MSKKSIFYAILSVVLMFSLVLVSFAASYPPGAVENPETHTHDEYCDHDYDYNHDSDIGADIMEVWGINDRLEERFGTSDIQAIGQEAMEAFFEEWDEEVAALVEKVEQLSEEDAMPRSFLCGLCNIGWMSVQTTTGSWGLDGRGRTCTNNWHVRDLGIVRDITTRSVCGNTRCGFRTGSSVRQERAWRCQNNPNVIKWN